MSRPTPDQYLAQLQQLAQSRGGALLSPRYLGDAVKLRWRCADGHEFEQRPTSVKQGKWCRQCGWAGMGLRRRAPFRDQLYRLVAQRGGTILSSDYAGSNTPLQFRCAEGHEWRTIAGAVLRGSWCRRCSTASRHAALRDRVRKRMERIVSERGGTVLGSKVQSGLRRFEVQCDQGHRWWSLPQGLDLGTWCQACAKKGRLDRLRRIATERGGVLLTTEYVDGRTKMRLQCGEFHHFKKCPEDLLRDQWCPTCGRAKASAVKRAISLARLRKVVAKRGGQIVSPDYKNQMTPLTFRCAAGHEWDSMPMVVWNGAWCQACRREFRRQHPERRLRRRDQLAAERAARRLQSLAEARGGQIHPPGFINFQTRLKLQCANGHVWSMLPDSLQKGTWCQQCKADALLAEMREHAARHDGECLSTSCRTVHDMLEWRCALGHRFKQMCHLVRKGQWCPTCRKGAVVGMERIHLTAAERGGECLSTEHTGRAEKLRWRCAEGHEWEADPSMVFRGHWCPKCADWLPYSRKRLTLADMQQTAAERGGQCLSQEYHSNKVALRWRCARGHTWSAMPNRIRQGSWCPACAHAGPGTLESMKVLALRLGGRCLTASWTSRQHPVRFECAAGHRFELVIGALKTGVWCPMCK